MSLEPPPPNYNQPQIQYQRDYILQILHRGSMILGTGLQYQCTLRCNGVILDAYTDSNSADRIYWSYSEEPSHRDVPLFSNSIVLLVQLVVL